ncbi:MAG: dockerin type I domain-containing protein [Pirellula sp.]
MNLARRRKQIRKLAIEPLESRRVMATLPYGAEADDTGEFLLGRIAVTPIFLESDGSIDPSTENWTPSHINTVLSNIQTGLNWWTSLLSTQSSVHTLEWIVDPTFATTPKSTPYEPIARNSNAYVLWVSRFLSDVGFSSSNNLESNLRDFNNAQREKLDTDWSFTIFVVNSVNDGDGSFAPGGSFSRAFAFAGGLFQVVPSTRPASTFTHETGHMFWARDEYIGGGNYFQRRGYYNAQNTNAIDLNPTPNFQQELSIMSAGSNLQMAYDTLVSADATLAQLGWQDSDSDGIFDVLDVPLKLDGTGRFNPSNNTYRFVGRAAVQTMPNRNTSGTQNDITLNKVGRIEYRINNGGWTPLSNPNQYTTDIDVTIPLGVTQGQIEIRATDPRTGVLSNIFEGTLGEAPDTTTRVGIQGFVWNDINRDGGWNSTETGLVGATVKLVDNNGQTLSLQQSIEPDNYITGMFSNPVNGVRVDVIGDNATGIVGIFEDPTPSTGSKIFKPYSLSAGNYVDAFQSNAQQLRVRFDNATRYVSIDAIAVSNNTDVRLEAYAADGSLIQRFERKGMLNGQKATLEVGSDRPDIASVIVRGFDGSFVKLDNLRYGPSSTTKTASDGSYVFAYVPPGTYNVQVTIDAPGFVSSNPLNGVQSVNFGAGAHVSHVDFGMYRVPSPWQNQTLPEDVNNLGSADPIDVLILINEINLNGSRALDNSGLSSPPYYDVNGDRVLSPLDILQVINLINRRANSGNSGNGEGESSSSSVDSHIGLEAIEGSSAAVRFLSFALDVRANQPTSWIIQNSSTRSVLGDAGPEKCGCPACAPITPAGEYSPSLLDIASSSNSVRNATASTSSPTLGPVHLGPDLLVSLTDLDAAISDWHKY